MARITDAAVAAAQRHFVRRAEAVRRAVQEELDLTSIDAEPAGISAAIVELAARWTPDALAALIRSAMQLAALEGREAVFAEMDPGAVSFADDIDLARQEFREQVEFLTQKRPKPTRVWTDAMQGDHDRAFVVAGATDIAMLEEFQSAIIAGARSYDRQAFAAEFDRIVEKYGWSYNGGREWRIRTIFETNIRTSYMAGRLRQMRDPDVVKVRPYWQYRHAETRVPMNPREEHVRWDNMVLAWDDPWWDVYFPPNDWQCSCGVRTLSRGDLRRIGKEGPDPSPTIVRKAHTHKATGDTVMLPEGVGYGWDYMPGDKWERGLVPSRLLDDPGNTGGTPKSRVSIDKPSPVADLVANARPFVAQPLGDGLTPEDYVTAFLQPFGAEIGRAVLYADVTGQRLAISDELFRARNGDWKVNKRQRDIYVAMIAEAIMDPDEIWLSVRAKPMDDFAGYEDLMLTRRYIRVDPATGLYIAFDMGRRIWKAITAFAPRNRAKPDFAYLDRQRTGKLIWKRE